MTTNPTTNQKIKTNTCTAVSNLALICVLVTSSGAVGYLLSQGFWHLIVFPFSNPFDAVGKLALAQYNPLNNYARWLIFILLPTFLLSGLLASKRIFSVVGSCFYTGTRSAVERLPDSKKSNNLALRLLHYFKFLYILLPLTLIYLFFTQNWSTSAFDMFHEGEQLTPALNYESTNSIWKGSLFVHGALYDVFTAILGWDLFDVKTIGAYRVAVSLLVLFKDMSLVLLLYIVARALEKALSDKRSAMLLSSLMVTIYFFTLRLHNMDRRMLPVILTLCCLFSAHLVRKQVFYVFAGLLSVVGIFYSLDSGIYSVTISFAYLVLTWLGRTVNSRIFLKNLVLYLLGVSVAVAGFYATLGRSEISQFVIDFVYFFKVKDLVDSTIYPFPDLLTNLRTTFPAMITAINVLIFSLVVRVVYLHTDKFKELATIHSTLLVTSLVLYRTALGRSDLLHIETSSTFIFVVFGFNLGLLVLFHKGLKRLVNPMLTLSFLLNLFFIIITITKTKPVNLIAFPKRTADFIVTKDLDFVNSDRREGIRRLRDIFNTEDCVVNLTSEASIPYFLSKPSCGRIYISYFASAEPVRSELLSTLVNTSPKYILYASENWTQNLDNITNMQRFPIVIKYVQANYDQYETVSNYWTVYRIRNL